MKLLDVDRIGRDIDWKDPDVVAGWGLEGTAIGRDDDVVVDYSDEVAGSGSDVAGRRLEGI